jgi:hypothetical protein
MPSPEIDVALIHVPYAPLERPAIGLGLLQAGLELKGFKTRCIYANLDFASRVGMPLYQLSDTFASEALIGEWTFSKLAFPEFEPDEEAFFELHRLQPNYIKALQAMRPAPELLGPVPPSNSIAPVWHFCDALRNFAPRSTVLWEEPTAKVPWVL